MKFSAKFRKRAWLIGGPFFMLCFWLIHFFIPSLITEIRHPLLPKVKLIEQKFPKTSRVKHITFPSFDALKLSATIIFSDSKLAKANIILVHGIRSNKTQFSNLNTWLAKQDYNVISIDLRAHGESEGKHCTYGVKEKKDISALIDYLKTEEKLKAPFGIWGQSLGGGIALQALADDQRLKFGIIESTFSEMELVTQDYIARIFGFDNRTISDYLINRAGSIADFDTKQASPKQACSQINQAILMVHGNKDQRIDIN